MDDSLRKSRIYKLKKLMSFYLENLVEDPIDGTYFDLEVIDLIEYLIKRYERKNDGL